jgi:lipoate-protein ligase A
MATTPDAWRVSRMTPEEYARSDEEMLRAGRLTSRVAVLSGSALSVGVSQREDAPCAVKARALGIPVVRRSTGGLGLLLASGDLAWSWVLPRADPRVGHDFLRAYSRLGAAAVQLLKELGVSATWTAPRGLASEYCLLSGRGAVLSIGGRALGGAAQHLTREALLHHGVLPYRLHPDRLEELFDLRSDVVTDTLTSLAEVTVGRSPMELARRLGVALMTETR